jgi:hypothetical protein
MAKEYARLDLLQDIKTAKGPARAIVVMRPIAGELMDVLDSEGTSAQIIKFVTKCARAEVNGELVDFPSEQLDAADAAEFSSMVTEMTREAEAVPIGTGDGITEPLVYTLQHPIRLATSSGNGAEPVTIAQIEFKARRLGEISEFLDSQGAADEFRAFMRSFGTLMGVSMPMSDSIINALDFIDYLVIRRKVLGKLATSRRRWKKTST